MKTVRSTLKAYGKTLPLAVLVAGVAIGWAGSAVPADTITNENVAEAVATAKRVEEHQALAAYFMAKSKEVLDNVQRHKRMAGALGYGKQAQSWEAHCNSLMRTSQEQAKDYAALAAIQEAMAKGMRMQQGM